MTIYALRTSPAARLQVQRHHDRVLVDGLEQPVRALDASHYVVQIAGRPRHVRAVTQGDVVHLLLDGRAYAIERIDATRGGATTTTTTAGRDGASAPMPGMVVRLLAEVGATVRQGDPLLVIESMKLQMTLCAPHDGCLEALPFDVGARFERGAVLATVRKPQEAA